MRWRRQLPAYSPLPARAVLAGARGLLGDQGQTRRSVHDLLARHFGARDVLLTDSGTGALALAIRATVAAAPGSPVALPAYSCYDLATAADEADAPVLLYDVDPATLAPELPSLREALTRGARAVVLVHLYGVPAEPDAVRAAAAEAGASLIEDAAQGASARIHGRPVGTFGDLVVLSFGRGKGTTAGRGGALLARDERASRFLSAARTWLLPPARGFRETVQLAAQWLLARPWLYALPASLPFLHLGETIYHRPAPVRGLSAAAARTLLVTWSLAEREAGARKAHAARLLAGRPGRLAAARLPDGGEAGYLRLPMVAPRGSESVVAWREARSLGIMGGYPTALCDLGGFRKRVLNLDCAFPGARRLAQGLLTLPTHSLLRESDTRDLEAWLARQ